MKFHHDDFLKPTGLPRGIDSTPGIKNCYVFAVEFGPVLIGPVPVNIKVQDDPRAPLFGEKYILVGETPYWDKYGEENRWGQSGYYLVFATPEQVTSDPEHILVN